MTHIVKTPKKGNKQFMETARAMRNDKLNLPWDEVIGRGKVHHERETPTHHEVITSNRAAAREVAKSLKNDHNNYHEHPAKIKGMSIKEHEHYANTTKKKD